MSQELVKTFTDKITSEFPDVKYASAKLITHGWDNHIVILDDAFVFRFPKNDEYLKKFKIEVTLIKYLEDKVNIPIPSYRYVAHDQSFGGYPLIPGEVLRPEIFQIQTDAVKEQMAIDLANFLTITHQTPKEVISELQVTNGSWSRPHVEKMYAEIKEKVYPTLSEKEVSWIEHQFQKYFSLKGEPRLTLVHKDLHGDNMLFSQKNGKISGILDFADAEYGDSALDFSEFLDYGEDFMRMVFDRYEGIKDEDMFQRAKFRRLVGMVENMLEITKGKKVPTTFEEQRMYLNKKMELFPLTV
jgi:aminoglycoside 2''-phosphotransferase